MDLLFLILALNILVIYGAYADTLPGDPRIVGGFPATLNNTKHQASIRLLSFDQNFGAGHICGGSLIDNTTILTAAHCMYDQNDKLRRASDFRIVGGILNRNVQTENTFVSTVQTVRVHKNYNAKSFEHDLAIMKLTQAVPWDHPTFQPIPITVSKKPDNTICLISGWGTLYYEGPSPAELRAANVTIINKNVCNGSYQGMVSKNMFCAGKWEGGVDACQGDSGGPLVCNGQLTGVTSNGYECARPGFPGIYVDLTEYSDWIKNNSSNRLVMTSTSIFAWILFVFLSSKLH